MAVTHEIDQAAAGRHREVRAHAGPLPGRRPGGRRLPGLPPQQRHLRPAPGRPQPDGAGQDPLRRHDARAARDVRPHRRHLLPRLGPHHHPPEHPVPLRRARGRRPPSCATWPRSGLTTREACGDTVRNIQGCHLAGACPYEVLDITPWAEAAFQHFLRHPYSQRLPRKFKINFSGCATDCGQAMFNDVGVIAVSRPEPDGTVEPGFRVFIAGGLGANPYRGAGARGVHAPRGTAAHPRGRASAPSTTTATATTSCGPA